MTKEDLQQIRNLIKEELEPIKKELEPIKSDIAEMKESLEEVRTSTNSLLEWAEECSEVIKFPLPRLKNVE